MKLNNVVVVTSPFGADILRTVHEIVDNGVLQLANNTLTITATAGTGTIEVSDVVAVLPDHGLNDHGVAGDPDVSRDATNDPCRSNDLRHGSSVPFVSVVAVLPGR